MNISAVTFKGTQNNNCYNYDRKRVYNDEAGRQRLSDARTQDINVNRRKSDAYYKPPISNSNTNRTSNVNRDEFTRRTSKKNKNAQAKKGAAVGFSGALLLSLMINFYSALSGQVPAVVNVPVNNLDKSDFDAIAQMYDIPENILEDYNNIENDYDYEELENVKIPTMYNTTQEKIDEVQDKLYSKHLSAEKRNELERELKALKNLQAKQNSIAQAYTDGRYIYFYINMPNENGEIDENASVNVEFFKQIFGIKDGYVQCYNRDLITVEWKPNENGDENDHGYFDYTSTRLHNGDVIKVPKRAMNKDVDLTGFYK